LLKPVWAATNLSSLTMSSSYSPVLRAGRNLLLAGAATALLSACAANRATSMAQVDYSSLNRVEAQDALTQLTDSYKRNPRDKATVISYAAALRAAGQADQATAVLENGVAVHPKDVDIRIAYAKALTAAGRFDQALNVLNGVIDPSAPDWNALSVKGAVLDQMGRNAEARELYQQALLEAPGEPSLEANLGLSYAMTNDLTNAEAHLRKAAGMQGATSQIRQNLALVIGLQGRFDEARKIYAAELPPDQVEANMSYIKGLLTQQNRWDVIEKGQG
jgi:Flp pilus assembly protein TadD